MTDAEIIKALECCTNTHLYTCDDCPFNKKCESDENVLRYALDLINRQKEYIKKCDNLERIADKTIASQKAEIERLQSILLCFMDEVTKWENKYCLDVSELPLIPIKGETEKIKKAIKSEAIKEFAERLEDEAYENDLYNRSGYPVKAVTIADVKKAKKEMAGDTE